MKNSKIVYGLNVSDVQNVAGQAFNRHLTNKEIALVEESIGDYIDWFQAIENAIRKHVHG